VDDLGARVLVLAVAREGDRAPPWRSHEVDARVFIVSLEPRCSRPINGRVGLGDRALGDEVVDVRRPVLHGRVADARAGLAIQLDDAECSESLE